MPIPQKKPYTLVFFSSV